MSYISAISSKDRNFVSVFERFDVSKREINSYKSPHYFYTKNSEGEFLDIYDTALQRYDFDSYEEFYSTVQQFKNAGTKLWESDISVEYKVLSENYFNKNSKIELNTTFFDIEVDYDRKRGFSNPQNPYAPVSAISVYHRHYGTSKVMVVLPSTVKKQDLAHLNGVLTLDTKYGVETVDLEVYDSEADLLLAFLVEIDNSDIISGWNSEGFDVPYVYERLKQIVGIRAANLLSFEGTRAPRYKTVKDPKRPGEEQQVLDIFGRVHLDFLLLYKKFVQGERDSYQLDSIAEEELGINKIEYDGSLADLYEFNFFTFLDYNAMDTIILKHLDRKTGYVNLAVMLSHMDAAQINDVLGTVKLTELSIINYCHYTLDRKVPDTVYSEGSGDKFGGAFVLPSVSGLHDMVGSIDVTSLYPSAMRTVNISPDTLLGQCYANDTDYSNIIEKSDKLVNIQFKDGSSDTKSGAEWNKFLRSNNYSISGFGTIFDQNKKGIIPALLESWFSERQRYKALAHKAKSAIGLTEDNAEKIKNKDLYDYYDKVQSIFKLKLNSTYGAFGNRFFKFFDIRLAESTTKSGREVLFHMARSIGLIFDGEYAYPNKHVIYGDTDSNYFKTNTDNVQDAFRVANDIADYINKSFPKFLKKRFLCIDGFDNMMSVSQEIISDKCIFTDGKKNYIMRVLKKDGKDVDEIKITGLGIKKTSLPKKVREKLQQIIGDFLRGEQWEISRLRYLEFMEYLMYDIPDKLALYLPSNVNKVEIYTNAYNIDNETRIAGGQAAAIFWNICLDQYNDTESFKIVSGMKIKRYVLKKKFGRFSSIAIPVDQKTTPQWFMDNIYPLIDEESTAAKLVLKPMEPIVSAMKETIPTRKELTIYDGFNF